MSLATQQTELFNSHPAGLNLLVEAEAQAREINRLREENRRLREMNQGTHCPVCDQYCKVYTRTMNGQMAATLIALFQKVGQAGQFLHLTEFQKWEHGGYSGGGNFSLLAYWDFIVPGEKSGYWALTAKGIHFVNKKLTVPAAVRIYNNQFLGFDDHLSAVGIQDVLNKKFNYHELMGHS